MIDRRKLERFASTPIESMSDEQAFDLCKILGPLARWWLPESVRAKARAFNDTFPHLTAPGRPMMRTEPGACWVACVPDARFPALGKACALPLRWQANRPHERLPRRWWELADQIVADFARNESWGLTLDVPASRSIALADDLDISPDSAWAALAGSLILARNGLSPDRSVWASAAWNYQRKSIANVTGLIDKMMLAREFAAERFFVVEGQLEELSAEPDLARMGESFEPSRHPNTVLGPYLRRLGQFPEPVDLERPDANQRFEKAIAYYQLLTRSEGQTFYLEQLKPMIAQRLRTASEGTLPSVSVLVAIVSDGWEVIPMLAEVFQTRRVVLFSTDNYREQRQQTESWLKGYKIESYPFTIESMHTIMKDTLTKLATEVSSAEIVCDLTLGSKAMSFALERAARQCSDQIWMNYIYHTTPQGRPCPGTERLELWQSRESA